MSFTNRFMTMSEGSNRNAQTCVRLQRAARTLLPAILLCSSLFWPAASLQAEEKQQEDAAVRTTEGLLATTEDMIEQLILQIDRQKENIQDSRELTDNPHPTSFFSSIPNIKPVNGSITSRFGSRVHPVYNVTLFHSGVDFSAAQGTMVHSTGDGIVAFSGYDKGYGQKVTINHGYGYKTIYAHLSKSLVRQGQNIKRGEIIALSGSTGVSTGPHLHYEVQKDNVKVNPTAYFFDDSNPDKFITIQKSSPEQRDNNS